MTLDFKPWMERQGACTESKGGWLKMNANANLQPTLFISYCWNDGNVYADELEAQLTDYFDVKRDKSQLIVNDDINDFMAEIANCDYVLIVLTAGYVKSLNCMREVAYLLQQPDWKYKSMVLVVDETIYSTDRKIEILNYWSLRKKKAEGECTTADLGKIILEEEASVLYR